MLVALLNLVKVLIKLYFSIIRSPKGTCTPYAYTKSKACDISFMKVFRRLHDSFHAVNILEKKFKISRYELYSHVLYSFNDQEALKQKEINEHHFIGRSDRCS